MIWHTKQQFSHLLRNKTVDQLVEIQQLLSSQTVKLSMESFLIDYAKTSVRDLILM